MAGSARSVLAVESAIEEDEKPPVLQSPVPLPLVAEAILVGVAESIAQLPPAHWNVGAEPVPPLKLAPVEFRVSELAGSEKPPET